MSAFGKAFAAARAKGEKTFMWNGKSYHTRTAEEDAAKAKPKPAALPKAAGREAWVGENVGAKLGASAAATLAAKKRDASNWARRDAAAKKHLESVNNPKRMAKGGSVRGNGCAKRGYGKGRMV